MQDDDIPQYEFSAEEETAMRKGASTQDVAKPKETATDYPSTFMRGVGKGMLSQRMNRKKKVANEYPNYPNVGPGSKPQSQEAQEISDAVPRSK